MKIKNILENMEDSMPVTELTVKVTEIYTRKDGTSEFGPWSFQDIKVEDETGEIYIKCKNVAEMEVLKNQRVTFSAVQSKQYGWVGLKTKDEEWQDKITRKLQLTSACDISIVEDGSSADIPDKSYDNAKPYVTQDDRQLMICRQNALTNSIKFAELSKVLPNVEGIIATAEAFAQWTYTGKTEEVYDNAKTRECGCKGLIHDLTFSCQDCDGSGQIKEPF